MASPVPYSEPKRRLLNKKTLKFATAPGSFIYAPVTGKAYQAKGGIVIKTDTSVVHQQRKKKHHHLLF